MGEGKDLPCKCTACGHAFGWMDSHYVDECIAKQLEAERAERARQSASAASWKEAWFRQRAATGMYGSEAYVLRHGLRHPRGAQ